MEGELNLIDRRTFTDAAYESLCELLISGRVAPGEKLALRDLSRRLGVSMMPVRDAVSRLIADQALEVTAGRVLRVPFTSAAELRELADVRAINEGYSAERAATRRTAQQMQQIAAAEAAFRNEAACAAPDLSRIMTLNRNFHFAIYGAAEMPILVKFISGLWLRAGPILNLDLRVTPGRLANGNAVRFHRAAMSAIAERDGPAASAAIQSDIRSCADFILAAGELPGDKGLTRDKKNELTSHA